MHAGNSKRLRVRNSKAVFAAVLQYSNRKIQENRCLRIKRMSQQLTISICVPKMVWPTYFQKNNLVKVSLLLRTRKFVEEMKQEYRSTARRQRPEVFENDVIPDVSTVALENLFSCHALCVLICKVRYALSARGLCIKMQGE